MPYKSEVPKQTVPFEQYQHITLKHGTVEKEMIVEPQLRI
jgi:hypothetical protein